MTAFTDLPRLIDDTITAYLAAAQSEEFTEAQAIEDILKVVTRHAREVFGKRASVALVERVMAEDPRPEGLPVDADGVISILEAAWLRDLA